MSLSDNQITAIKVTERVSSVLSLLGASVIIITFLWDKSFRKPINRLVFYAAWGNVMANVGTIISVAGITGPAPLCQLQGFLIQWFMPADALWTFAMACNVYLTFFHKFDSAELRKLEWIYFTLCYGLPFIPAVAYFGVDTAARGRVYGPAVLWCWVSIEWDFLRIAIFYGPVWFIIFATFLIYIACGRIIFKWRRQLLNFAHQSRKDISTRDSMVKLPMSQHRLDNDNACDHSNISHSHNPSLAHSHHSTLPRYTATVSVSTPAPIRGGSSSSMHITTTRIVSSDYTSHPHNKGLPPPPIDKHRVVASGANRAAINYCRTALLFFLALCITWIPSTINRVYSLAHPDRLLFGTNYASGLVLPLQGFWNAAVYVSTSLVAFRRISISKGVMVVHAVEDIQVQRARSCRVMRDMEDDDGIVGGDEDSEEELTSGFEAG